MMSEYWSSGIFPETTPTSQNYNSLRKNKRNGSAKIYTSDAFLMFKRYLLQKAMSVFKWTLPKGWDRDYFLYNLYTLGNVCQFDHIDYGNVVQRCAFEGHDLYYRPTKATIVNAVFTTPVTRKIVKEEADNYPDDPCIIWHLTPDYAGIMDLVSYYAGLMANISGAIETNTFNTRVAYLFIAKNKAVAETMQEVYNTISEGNPAVFVNKALFDEDGKPLYEMLGNDVKSTYIIDALLNDLATIDNMFSQEVGIPNANTQKKERMITDEVNANNFETRSKCELWLDGLKKCCDLSRSVFGEENTPEVDWREELLPELLPEPVEVKEGEKL